MKKIIAIIAMVFTWSSVATANEIYIEQVGSGLDLDITQDGEANEIGVSTAGAVLEGADMTFSITQTGNYNTIAATIKGSTYTGLWDILGGSNDIDLLCSSTAAGNCDTVTLNVDIDGDNTTLDFDIGEVADATNSSIDFTIDGDGNVVEMTVDGKSADIDVVVDNSSSGATTAGTNGTLSGYATTSGNVIDIDVDGDGDLGGHTIDLTVTGGGSYYNITQSGINDNTLDATFSGDNQAVDITQSD